MAFQLSVEVRNARANVTESTIGASPTLEIRSGAAPVNCAAADSGTVLATLALPADWLTDAVNGAKGLLGTWQDASADNAGVAGHFRIKASSTCHAQGTVTTPDAEPRGDMTLQNTNIAPGQEITITSFALAEGNA